MLKQYKKLASRVVQIGDAVAVLLGFLCAYVLVQGYDAVAPLRAYGKYIIVFVALWAFALRVLGMYASFRVRSLMQILGIVLRSGLMSFFCLAGVAYLLRWPHISRILVLSAYGCATLAVLLERVAMVSFFRAIRRRGYNYRSVLIVGTNRRALNFCRMVAAHHEWGLRIAGLIDEVAPSSPTMLQGHPVIGGLDDIPNIVHSTVVDEVVFVVPRVWLGRIEPIMHFLETEGVKTSVAADFFEMHFARTEQEELGGVPLLVFSSAPNKVEQLYLKRLFDMIMAGVSLVMLSPLLLGIAVAVKLTSAGPVFFRQQRCGMNGRRFTLYKFRTMVPDAEQQLAQLQAQNEMSGPVFKMSNDPRVTPLGRFLRRSSLDELPQLWNIVTGDMSIVGPRPPLPAEVAKYDSWQRRRLSMRPGLTCIWQASGRNRIQNFDEWMRLDLKYIDNWSLLLDLQLITRTIPVVLFGVGAK